MTQRSIAIPDVSAAGQARRTAMVLAAEAGLNETDRGRVGVIATEAANNIGKFAPGGEMIFQILEQGGRTGIEIVAIDKGPGIRDVHRSMEDGHSTSGTPGTGLGAIRRMADSFELQSMPNDGTVLVARCWPKTGGKLDGPRLHVGTFSVAVKGETRCGDAWATIQSETRAVIAIADGLGHGGQAADAAEAAIRVVREHAASNVPEIMERAHAALRPTRGAAIAIADIRYERGEVRFVGVGNVAGIVLGGAREYHMVSHNGTLGHEMRKVQEFTYPWEAGSVLVMHSDGIATHWNLDKYPGLLHRDPTVISAVLYRDCRRQRDDATVLTAKEAKRKR